MEELSNVNEINTENSESTEKVSPADYKIIVDMIREMDEHCKALQAAAYSLVSEHYDLKTDILDDILKYDKKDIPNLAIEEIREFLLSYANDEVCDEIKDMSSEDLVEELTEIKNASLVMLSAKAEADKLKTESSDILKEYFNYMSSDRVRASREKQLEVLRKGLEIEADEVQKSKIQKMINTMEAALNFSFLEDRFDKLGTKEIESIKEGFFDGKKGTYIISKYLSKIERFGYKQDLYKHFFNIEENFLSESYAPYNNLFLYIYMRMVAYSDPNNKHDKMLVLSLTGALANLIYHKFDGIENEQQFLSVIRKTLDHFVEDRETFIECNTTYAEHPLRKKAVALHDERRREALFKSMDKLGIKGYDKESSTDELQEFYNKEVDLLTKKQVDEYNNSELDIDEDSDEMENVTVEEDGTVGILPNIQDVEENKEEE